MKVSIILPTRNNENTIKRCLESIEKQTYKNKEVIFIDNYSTDNTYKIAKHFSKKINIKLFKKWPERNTQRPYWGSKASWDILYFLDSDMYPEKNLIEEAVKIINWSNDIWALIVPEENIVYNSFWSKVKAFERSLYNGDDSIEAARIFRKEVYEKLWWYNEKMISWEDWDLSDRVKEKYKIKRTKTKILHDEGKVDLITLLKKKMYYWKNFRLYRKHNSLQKTGSKIFYLRKSFYIHWKEYIKHPVLFIWMLVMIHLTILFFWIWYIKWR